MITSAFTCTGPYAVLIMLGVKRAENRSMMPEEAKGRCAVGCSKSFCREEFGNFVQWAARALSEDDFARLPSWSDVREWPGKIVGACDYSCRERSGREPWDEGYRYWWALSVVAALDIPIPCRGNRGMWKMPPSLAAQVTAADSLARMVGEKVSSAADAARMFRAAAAVAGDSEGFFVLPLDAERRVLSEPVLVALGSESTTDVRLGDVMSAALRADADAIVVAHNHPSGDLRPSADDVRLTSALRSASEMLGVSLLDHLIVSRNSGNSEFEVIKE